ncbi:MULTISPECIES: methyl-accepting chemotaxis protein [Pseudanabaena]|uniref:Methyl-accepting chemotaxis sensory transducer n=2 Tax=Pseudanabaena TaxID=1152 RepID=L8N4G9_9CYAN|nr:MULTISPECIES: methyl-accepting chemotaxis protein [Pseudanabaena]ELS33128.1 methyl-accepting chemotaxis sensory transducer [Pseudanabaena biceps PCC 7429]MDG3494650.1 methyl-accepting chemotaxis protein [Pseudanabaena catenata USMAC16]
MVLDSRTHVDSTEKIKDKGDQAPANGSIDITEITSTAPPTSGKKAASKQRKPIGQWWQALGLRTKTTIVSVAAITIPLISLGGFAYLYVGQNIANSTKQSQALQTQGLATRMAYFMRERYGDAQTLSQLSFLTNPKVQALLTAPEQKTILENYLKSYLVYDSIAVAALDGRVFLDAGEPSLPNVSQRPWFQTVLTTDKPFISQPEVSPSSKKVSIFVAAPVKDVNTGKTIAIIRARLKTDSLDEVIKDVGGGNSKYYLTESDGSFFLATDKDRIGRTFKSDFPLLTPILAKRETSSATVVDSQTSQEQFAGYAPLPQLDGLPDLKWDAVLAIDSSTALKPLQQLLLILLLATTGVGAVATLLAIFIAQRATQPVIDATAAVVELGKGNLDTRLTIQGQDELAQLGGNINLMAGQLQEFIALQEVQVQQSAEAAERERLRSESIQRELIELLSDVEGAASGDLTVRAKISAGEIGIVADFFNAIVESLRDVVSQVKVATLQVNTSVNTNNESIRTLASDATLQAEQLDDALQSVEQMTDSIQQVASNAKEAADASNSAAATAETGSLAIEKSAESILQLRQTVAETAKKVKRLGEASQQISKVVVLIDQIALKTNMLAVNASIEAARAGEEGRGFAVVAEEVGALAAQSATATKEISRIVESIQQETSEVVESMEASTVQVVEGTNKVEDARRSLNQIVEVARKVNELFQGISSATTSQVQTSQSVKSVMENLSNQSQKSSETSREVSIALQETANVASKLQASVETFKVDVA